MVYDPDKNYLTLSNADFESGTVSNMSNDYVNPTGWTVTETHSNYVQTNQVPGPDGTSGKSMYIVDPDKVAGAQYVSQFTTDTIEAEAESITFEFDAKTSSWTSGDQEVRFGLDTNGDGNPDVVLMDFSNIEDLSSTSTGFNDWRHFEFTFDVDPAWAGARAFVQFYVNDKVDADGGGTAGRSDVFIDNVGISTVVCFASGTAIETSEGMKPVESLSVGDAVRTVDHGFQKIRWIGATKVSADELAANPKLLPVRIRAGALGQGLPRRDLVVSRQHRILVRSKIAQRMFGTSEILVAAIKLVGLEGIEIDSDADSVTYWHILFDRHEIIFAEDAPAESLFTGPEALKAVPADAREEIMTLFPQLFEPDFTPVPARLIPAKGVLVQRLVARHSKHARPLLLI